MAIANRTRWSRSQVSSRRASPSWFPVKSHLGINVKLELGKKGLMDLRVLDETLASYFGDIARLNRLG